MALDDGFIGLDTAGHVVGLDRQDLLQGISSAVSFQRPDFHFAEALAAELRLAAERLLGNEGVRAGGTGMDLIVDQMVELEVVRVADRDALVKRLAGPAVIEDGLAVFGDAALLEQSRGSPFRSRR